MPSDTFVGRGYNAMKGKMRQMRGEARDVTTKVKNIAGNLTGSREVQKIKEDLKGKQ